MTKGYHLGLIILMQKHKRVWAEGKRKREKRKMRMRKRKRKWKFVGRKWFLSPPLL